MENPYIPVLAVIESAKEETPDANTLTISFTNKKPFNPRPGQFIQMSVFGCGEFPASISAVLDSHNGRFETTVRRLGKVTQRLLDLPTNSTIGIRGPFGKGFQVEEMEGKDILLVAGGMGLAPIRYLALCMFQNTGRYGDMRLLYGAKTPSNLLFRDSFVNWERIGLKVMLTVEEPKKDWTGNVGVVTGLFDTGEISPDNTSVAICGPSLMVKSATRRLLDSGFREDRIMLSFQRRMQCGIGLCGHCMIGHRRVCLDGPVFAYKDIKDTLERLF